MNDNKTPNALLDDNTEILKALVHEVKRVADALAVHTPQASITNFVDAPAYYWQHVDVNGRNTGYLKPIHAPNLIAFEELKNIDAQLEVVRRNTERFVGGFPANNILLTGARGTGKSSLVKACLNAFAAQGLRMIEIDKEHLVDLPAITEMIAKRPEKFIIFCDDLTFEAGESGYKRLKTALDGSLSGQSQNLLIYATSNRRHILPEQASDNVYAKNSDGELHPGDAIEEKISLSERFGIWLHFYGFSQDEYLNAVAVWLAKFGFSKQQIKDAEKESILWARTRGAISGRIASQFAKDYAGRSAEQNAK